MIFFNGELQGTERTRFERHQESLDLAHGFISEFVIGGDDHPGILDWFRFGFKVFYHITSTILKNRSQNILKVATKH